MLAVYRVSEIWIGIVSAGIVLAGTDFRAAPRRLAALFADLSAKIAAHFGTSLLPVAPLADALPFGVNCSERSSRSTQ